MGVNRTERHQGVFRDSDSRMLFQFGREVNVNPIVHANVLTLREELFVAAVSWWTLTRFVKFESDYKLIVAWVADLLSVLWRFHTIFRLVSSCFWGWHQSIIAYIDRSGNETAMFLLG